jgi:hypothetical protein
LDVRIADAMLLPGPRDGQFAGGERVGSAVHREVEFAQRQEGEFDALVSVPVKPPGLIARRIPEADGSHLLQHTCRQQLPGVASPTEACEPQLAP